MGSFSYIATSIETHMTTERMKSYANFLEALGIIEKWQAAAKTENKELTRLAELQLAFLKRHQDLMLELADANLANTLIRNEKNSIIQKLQGM
tara:strand:- start:3579 stop:3857 length:279 start_codon:yes stop_codon:yes gene_type:complete